jgi:hypothetical protein
LPPVLSFDSCTMEGRRSSRQPATWRGAKCARKVCGGRSRYGDGRRGFGGVGASPIGSEGGFIGCIGRVGSGMVDTCRSEAQVPPVMSLPAASGGVVRTPAGRRSLDAEKGRPARAATERVWRMWRCIVSAPSCPRLTAPRPRPGMVDRCSRDDLQSFVDGDVC